VFSSTTFGEASMRVAETSLPVIEARVVFAEAEVEPETDDAKPPPEPKILPAPLHAALVPAIDRLGPKYQEVVAAAYARAFTEGQLRGMLAFFTSPDGAAAIAHRNAWARQDPAEAAAHPYVEAKTEQAFDASPPGQALKAHQQAIGHEAAVALTSLWPAAIGEAQAEYCRREPCGDPERQVFAALGKIWDQAAQAPAPTLAH
jgi:hypothetical protein